MKKISVWIILVFTALPSFADFKKDVSKKDVIFALEIITLKDLGVGESAYIETYDTICINNKNQQGIAIDTVIVTKRSDYSNYYKVTILPKQKAAIEILPYKKEKIKSSLKNLIRSLVIPAQCKNFQEYGIISSEEVYILEKIEGVKSLSELIRIYKTK